MRQWRALVAIAAVAAGLVGLAPGQAGAAPLLPPTSSVVPPGLAESYLVDASADNRYLLAANLVGGGIQRIDRAANTATVPMITATPEVAVTNSGSEVVQVLVAGDGEVTVTKTNPTSLIESTVVVGQLGAGTWSRVGPISISGNGRFVAFVAADADGPGEHVVLADTNTPANIVQLDASLPGGSTQRSSSPVVSDDGNRIVFVTASNAPGCTSGPGCGDVYLYDRPSGQLQLLSVKVGGGASAGVAQLPGISSNGRFVVFRSNGGDLVAGLGTPIERVYLRDLQTGTTVAVPGTPTASAFSSRGPSVSDDGRIVTYVGTGQADTGGGPVAVDTVVLADLADGSLVTVPRRPDGGLADSGAATPFLRSDGSEVAFASNATNLDDPPLVPWNIYVTRIGGPLSEGVPLTAPKTKFVPLTPFRVLDTRNGIGAPAAKPAPGTTLTVKVGGVGTVPSNALAVALNVTAVDATAPGFVTVFPGGGAVPQTSNLNLDRAGQTIPNLVVLQLANRNVGLFTDQGTHLLADVLGYFVLATTPSDGRYVAQTPARVLDTRNGIGAPVGKAAPGGTVTVDVLGSGLVPATGVSAVVMNVTATGSIFPGFVTVWPSGTDRPTASNLNLERANQTIPNLVMVPVGPDGKVNLFTDGGTHLIADIAGYFTDATAPASNSGLFVPITPVRVQDTRQPFTRPLTESGVIRQRANLPPLPAFGVAAAMMNVTITGAKVPGFVTVYPSGVPLPNASNLNIERVGQTIPNAVVATLGNTTFDDRGQFDLYNLSGGHLIVDVTGYFRE